MCETVIRLQCLHITVVTDCIHDGIDSSDCCGNLSDNDDITVTIIMLLLP